VPHIAGEAVEHSGEQRPIGVREPGPRAVQLPFQDRDLVPERQDLSVFGAVTHRQEPEHRERVRHAEERQSQQHGQHHHPVIAGDPTDAEMSTMARSPSDARHSRDQRGRAFRHPHRSTAVSSGLIA